MGDMFCQSCGMPLENTEDIGTNADATLNNDYCIYCYKDGAYTSDVTMEEMIDISLYHMKEIFKDDKDFDEAEALENMQRFFPELKRWKDQ